MKIAFSDGPKAIGARQERVLSLCCHGGLPSPPMRRNDRGDVASARPSSKSDFRNAARSCPGFKRFALLFITHRLHTFVALRASLGAHIRVLLAIGATCAG
jgi:hypothetical protein